MKIYSERDIESPAWFGLKKYLRRLMLLPPFNYLLRKSARFIPEAARYRLPVVLPTVEYHTRFEEKIYLSSPDKCDVAREIYWSGGKRRTGADRLVMNYFENVMTRSNVMIDVGAYTGLFACVAATVNPAAKVFAFEILPDAYLILWKNIIINNLVGHVTPALTGVSDEDGSIIMPMLRGETVLPSSLSLGSQFSSGVSIPLIRLDDIMGEIPAGMLIIKIDVEGFENRVLAGAQRLLQQYKPDIICELLPDATGASEIQSRLKPLQYNFYQFTETGISQHENILPNKSGRDWLLTTRLRDEVISLSS